MNQCGFQAGWGCNYRASAGGKYCFYHKGTIPRFTKACFLAVSELYKDTGRTHCTVPIEIRCQGRVFFKCWLPNLLPWSENLSCQKTSQQEVASSLFQKTQKLDQSCCYNEERHEPVWFSGRFEATTIELSQLENTSLAIRPQCPGSQKHVSLHFQSSVKNTPMKRCTIPWEKMSGDSVLWVLTAIPVAD